MKNLIGLTELLKVDKVYACGDFTVRCVETPKGVLSCSLCYFEPEKCDGIKCLRHWTEGRRKVHFVLEKPRGT